MVRESLSSATPERATAYFWASMFYDKGLAETLIQYDQTDQIPELPDPEVDPVTHARRTYRYHQFNNLSEPAREAVLKAAEFYISKNDNN